MHTISEQMLDLPAGLKVSCFWTNGKPSTCPVSLNLAMLPLEEWPP